MFIYKYMITYVPHTLNVHPHFPYFQTSRRLNIPKKFYTSKEEGHLFQDTLLLYKI